MDAAAAYRAWGTYRGAGAATRGFLLARLAVAPLGAMGSELKALRGRVLSLGCGHALIERYLAEINPQVTVDGLELDTERVALADATQKRSPRVRAQVADVTSFDPRERYDAALAVDVLHHVPPDAHVAISTALARCLRPGGTLLVKDIATEPRPKYLFNRLHDRIVAGPEPIWCRSPQGMARLLERAGFTVCENRRLNPLSPYPHYLLTARRTA